MIEQKKNMTEEGRMADVAFIGYVERGLSMVQALREGRKNTPINIPRRFVRRRRKGLVMRREGFLTQD